ncbi:hypothetical protein L6452_30555, partial [Arctium lappa]
AENHSIFPHALLFLTLDCHHSLCFVILKFGYTRSYLHLLPGNHIRHRQIHQWKRPIHSTTFQPHLLRNELWEFL